ncbi:hypothetical protein SLA2020_265430 [Shorea laevis]
MEHWLESVDLVTRLAGMSLKSLCKLIIANSSMAMTVPGLAIQPSKFYFLTKVGLLIHVLLLCYIKNRLFNDSNIYCYGFEDEVMHPSYQVIVTNLVGLALVGRPSVGHQMGQKSVWILTCLYSSKLAMLFITSKFVVWGLAVLLLGLPSPLLLYNDKSRTTSKIKAWKGYAPAGVVALSNWFCQGTISKDLQW